jgi:3'(2'), 5'-bisphosphate nucleotidase
MNRDDLLVAAARAAVLAGRAILDVYRGSIEVEFKADNSPLTLADRRSHELIAGHLKPTRIPILSEEGRDIPHAQRRDWQRLWIVDPLDGTKEFVKRLGEFTVNIALVEEGRPTLGVVFVPVANVLYFGRVEDGSFRLEDPEAVAALAARAAEWTARAALDGLRSRAARLPVDLEAHAPYVIVGSRSHQTPELHAYVDRKRRELGEVAFVSAGSSLKYCLVAEGRADVYPRLGPTMEWDTAAGQVIAEAAGASVLRHDDGRPLCYNKEDLLNPWHVVTRSPQRA